jgi:AGZA family xanthine/uracil permease-like MFS transporter
MGTIFWGALGLLILTLLRVRYWLIANIPLTCGSASPPASAC